MNDSTLVTLIVIFLAFVFIPLLYFLIVYKYPTRKKPKINDLEIDGEVHINTTDPHKDTVRFELYYPVDKIFDEDFKEYIRFKIVKENQ